MACLSVRIAAVLTLSGTPGLSAQSARPAQPTLDVAHRNGQSFIVWRERTDLTGETYRIYRDEVSSSGVILATGTLDAEDVHEGSGLFLADRINSLTGWEPRYLERYVVPDTQHPGANRSLEEDEGLFVWTLAPEEFVDGQCPGFDDSMDANGNGIPDGCD